MPARVDDFNMSQKTHAAADPCTPNNLRIIAFSVRKIVENPSRKGKATEELGYDVKQLKEVRDSTRH
jgi:hypothetical protein